MASSIASCLLSTRGGVASSSAAATRPATIHRRRSHQNAAAASIISNVPSSSSSSRLASVVVRAEPLGSKETVQPFDEGAAQVQRLLKRDRLELLGEGDSLEDFISSSEFADGDEDKEKAGSSSSASPSSSAAAAATAATAAPVSPFGGGATPTSPFGGSSAANAAGADSASLGGGLRGSVFGAGGAAGSPFAAGGLPTARGASGLYDEAERMPGEMNRGLFGDGDESFNLEQQQQRKGNGAGEDFSKLPWWSGITLSQVVIAGSFLFTISLMLATAWFVNSVGAIRFNE